MSHLFFLQQNGHRNEDGRRSSPNGPPVSLSWWWWLLLHSAILRSRADSLHSEVILHEWLAFYRAFFLISTEVVYLQLFCLRPRLFLLFKIFLIKGLSKLLIRTLTRTWTVCSACGHQFFSSKLCFFLKLGTVTTDTLFSLRDCWVGVCMFCRQPPQFSQIFGQRMSALVLPDTHSLQSLQVSNVWSVKSDPRVDPTH